ncbi:OLC1v1022228C2 [Oldenlandia corymbosa var. corymbosa]|nr:OLC1v1022228C2 [Oldenlandia corymbosa var. corymbosa]
MATGSNMNNIDSSSSSSSSTTPCAACKLLRRKCAHDCMYAPYFPADEPHKFACVHKVFGASNVSKMLLELPEDQREDAVSAMVYEANARIRDPVYGCAGAISALQQQVGILQSQLAIAQVQVSQLKASQSLSSSPTSSSSRMVAEPRRHRRYDDSFAQHMSADNNSAAAAANTMLMDDQEETNDHDGSYLGDPDYSLWSY